MTDVVDRFFDKVFMLPCAYACWWWRGAQQTKSYGSMRLDGETTALAHRVVYELLVDELPSGLQVDHQCCNTICVNPDHLSPTTLERNRWLQHERSMQAKEAAEEYHLEKSRSNLATPL